MKLWLKKIPTSSMASENSVDTRASLEITTKSIGGRENDPRREREIRMECQNSRELVKGIFSCSSVSIAIAMPHVFVYRF